MRWSCQASAAWAKAEKRARDKALTMHVLSGCHCTATTQWSGASSSTASTTLSAGEMAAMRRLSPTLATAWWWLEFTDSAPDRLCFAPADAGMDLAIAARWEPGVMVMG